GKALLYDYCERRGVQHRRCGKLIVANTASQVAALPAIVEKARANGVGDLVLLTREQARAIEPHLECLAAVHSPSTGIVDSHALILALQGDLEILGGLVACHSAVDRMRAVVDGIEVLAVDGTALLARTVVNAAGLQACALALSTEGLNPRHVPRPWYAKGSYFTLSGRAPFQRLIYPAPEPDKHLAGLGVHLTLDLGGQAKFGPDVQWVDDPGDLQVDAARGEGFYAEVRRYWPGLPDGALQPGYAGMRPKISGQDEPAADFRIDGPAVHGVPGLVNLFGIESPGLTSSLAIAEHVAGLLSAQP
ncbi:MAG: NAD(P)/FAD-dependent oxidoreductase, partial [Hydrogenophaga sp.]|uniref:NAD(P)/FAD-dependent oxidoreductase n=1 Tax=Hydrogenophaga sp. TaxID=1904254 RepID=UPI003D9BD76A